MKFVSNAFLFICLSIYSSNFRSLFGAVFLGDDIWRHARVLHGAVHGAVSSTGPHHSVENGAHV